LSLVEEISLKMKRNMEPIWAYLHLLLQCPILLGKRRNHKRKKKPRNRQITTEDCEPNNCGRVVGIGYCARLSLWRWRITKGRRNQEIIK
jgi:hypothetical protein